MHRPSYVFEGGKARRKSSFQELLDDDAASLGFTIATNVRQTPTNTRALSAKRNSWNSLSAIQEPAEAESDEPDSDVSWIEAAEELLDESSVPALMEDRRSWSTMHTRLSMLAVLLTVIISLVQGHPYTGQGRNAVLVAEGGVVPRAQTRWKSLDARADTNVEVCKRWSQQSAVVNGTLFLYGGRATTDAQQTNNTWNNDFLTLDLTKNWDTGNPTLNGLAQPSGPPAVANGYLWNSHSSLFLYGGEFSDSPIESPVAFSMWEYDISSGDWKEHSDPMSSSGKNSEDGGQTVQRVAEGAGVNVPSLGRGWYFGGHEDYLTTEGWSNQVPREYLRSFLEFTFPGVTNDAVDDLSKGKTAGSDGVWRNISKAGLQETGGFTQRADGVLVYVPGFGKDGILLALGGGTNDTFTAMNVIDVFDIAESTWYKQSTTGAYPKIRVNPCAVVAAAADGSSYNIYMFGGQNLTPYKSQTQYQDMWILSVPSFTWIQVDMNGQSVPYARSGHTCNMWDGQMIVVGGYIGNELGCESPGVYVFDMSNLQWQTKFTSLTGGNAKDNPFSQQTYQNKKEQGPAAGLEGSYGYQVPPAVIKVIGGNGLGNATVTAPAVAASGGPLATGKPQTYTIPGSNPSGSSSSSSGGSSSGTNVGAIVAGVIAGVVAILAGYFAFCAWVYRRQLRLYKNHVAMVQRAATDPHAAEKDGFIMPIPSKGSENPSGSGRGYSSSDKSKTRLHQAESSVDSAGVLPQHPMAPGGVAGDYRPARKSSDAGSSTHDLMQGMEPSFIGVLMNPRKNLRVVNGD